MGFSKLSGVVLVLVFVSTGAEALDCKKARSTSSKQICANPDLLMMEEQADALYLARLATTDAKGQAKLKKGLETWLRERNSECRDEEICLSAKLRDRIAILKDPALVSTLTPADTGKGYKIAAWKDVQYPQLTELKEREVRKAVNEQIATEARTWSCPGGQGGFSAVPVIVHLDSEIFSYKVRLEFSCGEKQDFWDESRNFDLTTGASVTVTELFKEGLAAADVAGAVYKGVKVKPECKDAVANAPIEFNALGDELITFYPKLPFEKAECMTQITRSVRELKQLLRPGVLGAK